MPDHAGFAAAITLRERVLGDALLFAYSRQDFTHNLPILLFGTGPGVFFPAFLSPPTVRCDGTRGAIVVGVELTGALTFNGTHGLETQSVVAHGEVAIPPVFTLKDGELTLSPAHTDVQVVSWSFTVVGGTGFKPDTDAYLRSEFLLERLSATVQAALDYNLISLPSVDVSSLGAVVAAAAPPDTTDPVPVPARVVDGALVAGLNVAGFMPPWQPPDDTDGITLTGDPLALHDFSRGFDLAVVTNPDALPILLASVEQQVVDALPSGATLNTLTLTPGDGEFEVAGRASTSDGHATFSFSVIPHMDAVRPGGAITYIEKPFSIHPRPYAGLWFSTGNPRIDVSTDLSFWQTALAAFLTVITAGVFYVAMIKEPEEFVAYGFGLSIAGGNSGAPTPRVHRVSSASLNDVTLRIALDEYSITPDGPFMGLTITPEPKPPALVGPKSIPTSLVSQKLTYSLRLPLGVEADDPSLHTQWTVIDPASGTLKVVDDGVAKDRTTFAVVPNQVAAGLTDYAVGCRVYRTSGTQITEIFNDDVRLKVRPATQGAPYINWAYDVQRPWVTFTAAGGWTYAGEPLAHRHSKIHRREGGCLSADKISRYTYRITEMHSLPFPVADIDTYRAQVCDYCFYGGPAGLHATL